MESGVEEILSCGEFHRVIDASSDTRPISMLFREVNFSIDRLAVYFMPHWNPCSINWPMTEQEHVTVQVPRTGMFQNAQGIDASHSIFNDVGRDQFNVIFHPGTKPRLDYLWS